MSCVSGLQSQGQAVFAVGVKLDGVSIAEMAWQGRAGQGRAGQGRAGEEAQGGAYISAWTLSWLGGGGASGGPLRYAIDGDAPTTPKQTSRNHATTPIHAAATDHE
jgi:hypothetical protein